MLSFWFHAGSNFTSGTYSANTWQSRASTDVNRAVGIGSFFDSTDNEIRLTGLQMEVGENASDFEHRSFGEELFYVRGIWSILPTHPAALTQFFVAEEMEQLKLQTPLFPCLL